MSFSSFFFSHVPDHPSRRCWTAQIVTEQPNLSLNHQNVLIRPNFSTKSRFFPKLDPNHEETKRLRAYVHPNPISDFFGRVEVQFGKKVFGAPTTRPRAHTTRVRRVCKNKYLIKIINLSFLINLIFCFFARWNANTFFCALNRVSGSMSAEATLAEASLTKAS